ncbi:MAG: glycosyltransferase family 2 protein [bacterium]|nr:glycosyltransferase family 2 protein [bacterium]
MTVSIIIPVYNEERTILKVIEKVSQLPFKKEVIIVNDGSSDNTALELKKIKGKGVLVFSHVKNRGKGAAIKSGIKKATGDIIAIQDADLEYNPKELLKLITPIIKDEADVVYGSRFLTVEHRKGIYYLGNRLLTYLTQLLFWKKISDMETCYKVFSGKVLRKIHINSNRFDFEPEITAKILKLGIRFKELPISYKSRSHKEGKKLTWKDGLQAAAALIRYRIS